MGSRQNRERAIRLRELEIENATLRLGATAEARIKAEEQIAERLIAWIQDPKRKPANIAFTEGPLRQVAVWIEDALHRVSAGDIGAAILKEREECAKVAEESRGPGHATTYHVSGFSLNCAKCGADASAAAIRARKP